MKEYYGNWKVIRKISPPGTKHVRYLCICLLCKKEHHVLARSLSIGETTRCNDCRLKSFKRHTKSPTYKIWSGLHTRCYNANHGTYKYYGAKGIKVCERWKNYENFLNDMGERPLNYQIDRIDPTKDYMPSNCRWISKKENVLRARTTLKDISGQQIGKWYVIERDINHKCKTHAYFKCRCECGNVSSVSGSMLRQRESLQCIECKNQSHKGWGGRFIEKVKSNKINPHKTFIDLKGKQIGHWAVIDRDFSKKNKTYFKCSCECGHIQSVYGYFLNKYQYAQCKNCKRSLIKKE